MIYIMILFTETIMESPFIHIPNVYQTTRVAWVQYCLYYLKPRITEPVKLMRLRLKSKKDYKIKIRCVKARSAAFFTLLSDAS